MIPVSASALMYLDANSFKMSALGSVASASIEYVTALFFATYGTAVALTANS